MVYSKLKYRLSSKQAAYYKREKLLCISFDRKMQSMSIDGISHCNFLTFALKNYHYVWQNCYLMLPTYFFSHPFVCSIKWSNPVFAFCKWCTQMPQGFSSREQLLITFSLLNTTNKKFGLWLQHWKWWSWKRPSRAPGERPESASSTTLYRALMRPKKGCWDCFHPTLWSFVTSKSAAKKKRIFVDLSTDTNWSHLQTKSSCKREAQNA